MNSRFAVIEEDEMQKIDGGLLAGGLAGGSESMSKSSEEGC